MLAPEFLSMKCRVLVNYNDIIELTLEELINLVYQIEKKVIRLPEISIWAQISACKNNISKVQITQRKKFQSFLCHLYLAFRKMELKFIAKGCPVDFLENEELYNLNDAKERYFFLDETNKIKLYKTLKQLYFSYVYYLEDRIDSRMPIEEGELISGEIMKLQEILVMIDEWNPTEEEINRELSLNEEENDYLNLSIEKDDSEEEKTENLNSHNEKDNNEIKQDFPTSPGHQINVTKDDSEKQEYNSNDVQVSSSDVSGPPIPKPRKRQYPLVPQRKQKISIENILETITEEPEEVKAVSESSTQVLKLAAPKAEGLLAALVNDLRSRRNLPIASINFMSFIK